MQRSEWNISKSEVSSDVGVVATMYGPATEAGVAMLQRGGNAVDAAVAAGFAVGVVEPFNSGLGGIAIMVYHEARTNKTWIIDGTLTLPQAIRPDQFRISDPDAPAGIYGWPSVENDANNTGVLTPGVPGMPGCLLRALERFGTLGRNETMAPAIRYAEDGYPIDWYVCLAMAVNQHRLNMFPESRRVFYREDGTSYRAPMLGVEGDTFAQPDLARTLRLIAAEGPDAFYRGPIAEAISADMAEMGGLLSYEDFAGYEPRIVEGGIAGDYRGYKIVGGLDNSGFPTVLQALNILEGFDVAAMEPGSVEELHLMAEAQRLAFLDRHKYLGDQETASIPLDGILSKPYAAERRAAFDPAAAGTAATAGAPWPFNGGGTPSDLPPGNAGDSNTTHLTVIDKDRNMVSLLSTLGQHFGSAVVPRGTGIVLNNATMWFDPQPGRINSILPGRRGMTAGAPVIVTRDGKPVMATGAPGGRRVISSVIQTISNVLDHGMGPQEAVTRPRIHSEGPKTEVDQRVGQERVDALAALGHDIEAKEETFSTSYFGRPLAITVEPESGRLKGGVNQLKPALAIGL